MRSSKTKAMDQVKHWCGTMKSNEETEAKSVQQNIKRDFGMLEDDEGDEDIPVLKKKYFRRDSEDEDWDDPAPLKSITSNSENDEMHTNNGKIIPKSIKIILIKLISVGL